MPDVRPIDANALMGRIIQRSQALITPNGKAGYLGLFVKDIQQVVDEAPTINPDDLRPRGRYRIDGHHIRFKCCDKVLSIVPNESDDYENLVSCPFCNTKMDGKENEE